MAESTEHPPRAPVADAMGETLASTVAQRSLLLSPGTRVGRYLVLAELGAGAMGVVYAAYDPELDRKLALKLLRLSASADPEASSTGRVRLLREAQALARLDHPNVVTIHDVGVHAQQLFIAMEFIEGETLADWQRASEQPQPWRQVHSTYLAAGRGLAAAHAAGLIHRDFKPANVMRDASGRVRVMDFGLARARVHALEHEPEPRANGAPLAEHLSTALEHSSSSSALTGELTRTGALMGTPAYMSPEQYEAAQLDARSDQFSFCVALYEALYGERPFSADSIQALLLAKREGKFTPPPAGSRVPTWLRKIVVRGLAADPAQRWPSMQALLDAVSHDPAVRRRQWGVAAAIVALVGGGAWGIASGTEDESQRCSQMGDKLEGVWDEAARSSIHAAFEDTKLSYAQASKQRVVAHLDNYARAWVLARVDACKASERGEQSDARLDLRMSCLDERLRHLASTVELLASADATVVESAAQVVDGLPGLARCADVIALEAELPPPEDPELATRVDKLDAQLVEVRSLHRAGKYAAAQAIAEPVLAASQALGYEPLEVRALRWHGHLLGSQARYTEAVTVLEQAYAGAVALEMKREATRIAITLIGLTANDLAELERGRRWAYHARAWTRAAATFELDVNMERALGSLAGAEGNYQDARAHFERALAIQTEAADAGEQRGPGVSELDIAATLARLGRASAEAGDPKAAREAIERALELELQELGPKHPRIVSSSINLSNVLNFMDERDAAKALLERTLELARRSQGPTHPDIATILNNLGVIADVENDFRTSIELQEQALAIYEQRLGPDHPKLARSLDNLGLALLNSGEVERAETYFSRSLIIKRAALGEAHPNFARTINNLAYIAYERGELDEARAGFKRALAIREAALGPDHPELAFSLLDLGRVELEQGRPALARTALERALEVHDERSSQFNLSDPLTYLAEALLAEGELERARTTVERALALREEDAVDNSLYLAHTRFVLAKVLWRTPDSRAQARALVEQAAEAFAASTPRTRALRLIDAAIEAWPRLHPPSH